MADKIPIWLVTGFLGSGKTTLLRRIVKATQQRRVLFLVNEFSAVDVDAGLIEQDGGTALGIPGGSIFCRCLVTEFVSTLQRVVAWAAESPIEGVVIEASGMADPGAMGRLLVETRLDDRFEVAQVVSVVDPGTFGKLCHTLPNIVHQVAAADLVLVNKVDLHTETFLDQLEGQLARINPRAARLRCARADVPLELILASPQSAGHGELMGEFAMCRDPNYCRDTVTIDRTVSESRIRAFIEAAGDDLYRAKGYLHTDAGMRYVDYSAKLLRILPTDMTVQDTMLVVIWNGYGNGQVEAAMESLRAGG